MLNFVIPLLYDGGMSVVVRSFEVPTNLSPSRVDSFTTCPLAFRFSSIEKLPEPPGVAATKGSLVHRALELLFSLPAAERTISNGMQCLIEARAEYEIEPDYVGLRLDDPSAAKFMTEAETLMQRYFTMEDPTTIREIGIELRLEVEVGHLRLRGIIDRLELDDDGELVVTDYKTGRPPFQSREQSRLGGVHFYAFLCQQLFGKRPSRIQLMYLSTGETIVARPTEQSVNFLPKRTLAVWSAVEKACSSGSFRARPSALCPSCSFQAWCPSFGGDPERASDEAPAVYAALIGTPLSTITV